MENSQQLGSICCEHTVECRIRALGDGVVTEMVANRSVRRPLDRRGNIRRYISVRSKEVFGRVLASCYGISISKDANRAHSLLPLPTAKLYICRLMLMQHDGRKQTLVNEAHQGRLKRFPAARCSVALYISPRMTLGCPFMTDQPLDGTRG